MNFQMFKLVWEKAEEPEIKLPTSIGSLKKQESSRKISAAAVAAKSLQLYLTLWDPRDSSPPGSPIPGILQARTLGWVFISFSNAWKWKVKVKSLSRVRLLETPWTAAHQAPPSMGFSRQEYWSAMPLLSYKNEKIMPFAVTWMNLQTLILSEVSQKIKTNIIWYCL